jgi:hypothetical protein
MMLNRDLNAVAMGIPRGLFLTEPLSFGHSGPQFSLNLGIFDLSRRTRHKPLSGRDLNHSARI